VSVPRLLWRRALDATLSTLRGESRGQYDIRLVRPPGIADFFEGLPRLQKGERGGYSVQVPLEPATSPVPVAATSVEVAYIGPQSARNDWRITSQRPETAYPLWREGTGPLPSTVAGEDFVVIVRDGEDRFHARWLRAADAARLPFAAKLDAADVGIELLLGSDWDVTAEVLGIEDVGEVEGRVPDPGEVGEAYRPEDESVSTAQPDPFKIDPDVLDRGVAGHRKTQNAFAAFLEAQGLTPRSHRPTVDPPFDIAWSDGDDTLCVGEVKSITAANQEKQLRLALGQVLRYAHQLGDRKTVPVIIAEREPTDASWPALCESLGVRLAWPGAFDRAL
jgi:hypothetical protein